MAPPLRILRVIARLNVGGPARHVAILDEGLSRRGHTTMLAFGPVREGEGSLEDLVTGVPTRRIDELGRRIRLFDDAVAFARIFRLIRAYRPHIVHTHTAKAGTLGRLAAALHNLLSPPHGRARLVHTFHGHVLEGYFGPVGDWLVRIIERSLARLTDRIVAISPRQRQDLTGRFGICSADRVDVVPLGLDLDDLLLIDASHGTLRAQLGIAADAFVVGFIGRLVPIKDPLTLIAAFADVAASAANAVLVIAGSGPLEEAVRREVEARGLQSRVRFAGWQRDLAALYATCDLIALVSRNEGTPVAIIEAMAAGRAVVATAVGGVPDLVEHQHTGLLVPPGSSAAITAAILSLLHDPSLRGMLGARARDQARNRFRRERLVDDIERLYVALRSTGMPQDATSTTRAG
jgi:glycosyltransferase involved in cell wall biosynthesis